MTTCANCGDPIQPNQNGGWFHSGRTGDLAVNCLTNPSKVATPTAVTTATVDYDAWAAAELTPPNPANPLSGGIPAGTKVRLRTENGGDAICVLEEDYHPTHGCFFHHVRDDGSVQVHAFYRDGSEITSVVPAP